MSSKTFFQIPIEGEIPGPGPYSLTLQVFSDKGMTQEVAFTTSELVVPAPPTPIAPLNLGAYIDLWQYRNTDASYPYAFNSGWNPVVRANNLAANALPQVDDFYMLSEVQLNGNDSLLYFGNPVGFPAAAQVLNSSGTDWNTNTGDSNGMYISPTSPDYVYSAWALKNTIAYMRDQGVDTSRFRLCVGGYLLSNNMDLAGATPAQASLAASQIVTLMGLCDAKGVDIDYEPVGIPCDPARMATLMSAVYSAVKAVSATYEVHLTLIPSILQSDPDQKIATALACMDHVDQINVMTYDDPSDLGQVPYQPGSIPVYNHSGVDRSVQSVQWFIDAGVPANKLGMGIAMYARNSASPAAAFNASNPVVYSQIVASADAAGQTTNSFPLGRYLGVANIQNPSPTGKSNYYSPLSTALWGFDSVDTITSKVQASKTRGLRAVFAWQLSNDYANISSTAPPGDARANFALLSAARNAINTL
jgi:chitinase